MRVRNKSVLVGLGMVFLLILLPGVSFTQNENNTTQPTKNTSNTAQQQVQDPDLPAIQPPRERVPQPQDYSAVRNDASNNANNEAPSTYSALIQTIIFLIIFAIIVYVVIRVLRKRRGVTFLDNDAINVLATSTIALNKYVQVIEIGGKVYILGVTEHQVSNLGEIEEKDVIDELKLIASKSKTPNYKQTFASALNSVFGNKNQPPTKKESGGFGGIIQGLTNQKERLNRLKS